MAQQKEEKQRIQAYVTKAEFLRIQQAAVYDDVSMSQFVRRAVRSYINVQDKKRAMAREAKKAHFGSYCR